MPRNVFMLLTDFGVDDAYVAAMKAVLIAEAPDCPIVDVTHTIAQGDVLAGAFLLERALASAFPNTIHVAVVDPTVGSPRRLLLIEWPAPANSAAAPASPATPAGVPQIMPHAEPDAPSRRDLLTGHLHHVDPASEETAAAAFAPHGPASRHTPVLPRIEVRLPQWILCPDNGLATWAMARHPGGRLRELAWRPEAVSHTFHGRDILAPAAARLATGTPVDNLARPLPPDSPAIRLDLALAHSPSDPIRIIHIDRFGSASTNLPAEAIFAPSGGRPAESIAVEVAGARVRLVNAYADVQPGEPLALINSAGLLEIAVRDGSAARQLGLRPGMAVDIHLSAQ